MGSWLLQIHYLCGDDEVKAEVLAAAPILRSTSLFHQKAHMGSCKKQCAALELLAQPMKSMCFELGSCTGFLRSHCRAKTTSRFVLKLTTNNACTLVAKVSAAEGARCATQAISSNVCGLSSRAADMCHQNPRPLQNRFFGHH